MHFYSLIDSDINKIKNQAISIIGGGGKSSLLEKLGKELVERKLRVILTTTTKIQPLPKIALVLQSKNGNYLTELKTILHELSIALVAKEFYKEKNKLIGVNQPSVSQLKKQADVVLIEADGSRQRGLKTHKEHEPVIPVASESVIIICGADMVGEPLSEKTVHRAELFSKKWDLPMGTVLTPEIIARELLSPYSYLKNIPINANVAVFINKSDKNAVGAKLLAEKLLRNCKYPVFLGSLKNNQLDRIHIKSL